jgi:glycosyltransferase involved in cell wall biosynthesis
LNDGPSRPGGGIAVAVNATIVGERPTGLGVYTLNLIRSLDAQGERLVVYTSRPELVNAPRASIERVSASLRPERGAAGHLLRLLWIQTSLRWRVRRARSRLLLNLVPEGILAPSTPQVTMVHDLLPLQYPTEYPRQQYYFRHYVPAVLRASRTVIVNSESTRRDVLRVYGVRPEKIHVVLAGYEADRFTPDGPAGNDVSSPYALYVGNVMPHKNLLRLVDAFALVAKRLPLALVLRGSGRGPHVRALRQRIDALGLGDRVDWRPYAPPDELPALYRGARMLLLPSLYEGFGLTALEAMACGTPVVTSNVSSLPEVVGDAALLVDPCDTESIATAMERIVGDDGLAKELRERGLVRARLFSWESTARAVQRAMRQALTDPAGA